MKTDRYTAVELPLEHVGRLMHGHRFTLRFQVYLNRSTWNSVVMATAVAISIGDYEHSLRMWSPR